MVKKEINLKEIKEPVSNELEENKKIAEERLNQLKYLQADFDNYRKKFEKEKIDVIRLANENLIKELIVILEDLGRSLNQINDEKTRHGLNMIHDNFLNILRKHGLKEIEAVGKKFDYKLHEAVTKEQSEIDDGLILEEIQKGYILNGKVIKPSLVKVSVKKIIEEIKQ
ncbi:nucleotide exchange factor GrpE [Candidatus Woesearchaeota archaeon]|nr:nucleotide exchange factor GrpE [Candidatus Woesearchaeota archaeon]